MKVQKNNSFVDTMSHVIIFLLYLFSGKMFKHIEVDKVNTNFAINNKRLN